MSTERQIIGDGQAMVIEDMQQAATDYATADDCVTELTLFGQGTVTGATKKVVPLFDESTTAFPGLLAIPSPTTQGAIRLQACWLAAAAVKSGASSAPVIQLAVTNYTFVDSSAIPTNGSGGTRWVLVYATVSRSASTSVARLYRDVNDVEGSQSLPTFDTPTVTLNLSAFDSVAPPHPLTLLPGDGVGVYNFPIAVVQVAASYTAGQQVFQNSAGGSTYITQVWAGGGIPQQRITANVPSIYPAAGTHTPSTPMSSRFGAVQSVTAGWVWTAADGVGPVTVTLDNTIDYRNRMLWAIATRAPTPYGAPETVVNGGGISAMLPPFTSGSTVGGNGGGVTFTGAGNASHDISMFLGVSNAGALQITYSSTAGGGPAGTTDTWTIIVFYTPKFLAT